MSEYYFPIPLLIAFAEFTDTTFSDLYFLIRGIYPLNILSFYFIFLLFLYTFFKSSKKAQVIYINKTLEEAQQLKLKEKITLKLSETNSLINSLRSSQDQSKPNDLIKKVDHALFELKKIQELHNEFKSEIIDSHQQIINSLSGKGNNERPPENFTETVIEPVNHCEETPKIPVPVEEIKVREAEPILELEKDPQIKPQIPNRPKIFIPKPVQIPKPVPIRGKAVKPVVADRSKYVPPPVIKSNPFG